MPLDHFGLIAPIYARARYGSLEKMRDLAALPTGGRLLDPGGSTSREAHAVTREQIAARKEASAG